MIDWCPQEVAPLLETLETVQWNVHSVDGVSWLDKAIIPIASTLLGAVAGSATILYVEYIRRVKQTLADINTSIAIYGALINTLLNIKRQFVFPLVEHYREEVEKKKNFELMKQTCPNPPKQIIVSFDPYMKRYFCPTLFIDAPLERIFSHSHKAAQIAPIVIQTKISAKDFEHTCTLWNEMTDKMQTLSEGDRGRYYFGQRMSSGITDATYSDIVHSLGLYIDDALFFANRSISILKWFAERELPFWLKKRVCKSIIIDKEHKKLMPPDNHLEGWHVE